MGRIASQIADIASALEDDGTERWGRENEPDLIQHIQTKADELDKLVSELTEHQGEAESALADEDEEDDEEDDDDE